MLGRWTMNTHIHLESLMGNKGAGLLRMRHIGLPVPAAFVVFCQACKLFERDGMTFLRGDLWGEVMMRLSELESITGRRYGDPERPLLLSVRSGAPVSMPGMMDTILNVGINDEIREGLAKLTGNHDFAFDCQLRFLEMVGRIVFGIDRSLFRDASLKSRFQHKEELLAEYQDIVGTVAAASPFPRVVDDVEQQLSACIAGVLSSWHNERAIRYRKMFKIADSLGTGVVVQVMVFGNLDQCSGTGVVFSRDPSTGENKLTGEYLTGHQGEDVVSGEWSEKAKLISELEQEAPEVYRGLVRACRLLEYLGSDIQDIEFTYEQGRLYILQVRSAKASPLARLRFLVDSVREGVIAKEEALRRARQIPREALEAHLMRNKVIADGAEGGWILARGVGVSPGVTRGCLALSREAAVRLAQEGNDIVMVTEGARVEDIAGVKNLRGWFTAVGGAVSHATIVCREMGVPCVVNTGVQIDRQNEAVVGQDGRRLAKGQVVTLDGTVGLVCGGNPKVKDVELPGDLTELIAEILGTSHRVSTKVL